MPQNRSNAVMATRVEAKDSFDDFPTPPWATRALCEQLRFFGPMNWKWPDDKTVWEPACGLGHMANPLGEYFKSVTASDVQKFGYGDVYDFLLPSDRSADWIITNPPFRLAERFALAALERAKIGVALLTRMQFLETSGRLERLFSKHSPTYIYQFTERVPMVKGRLDKKASTATAYCWLVWSVGSNPDPRFHWIPPCRKRLERDEDYATA